MIISQPVATFQPCWYLVKNLWPKNRLLFAYYSLWNRIYYNFYILGLCKNHLYSESPVLQNKHLMRSHDLAWSSWETMKPWMCLTMHAFMEFWLHRFQGGKCRTPTLNKGRLKYYLSTRTNDRLPRWSQWAHREYSNFKCLRTDVISFWIC